MKARELKKRLSRRRLAELSRGCTESISGTPFKVTRDNRTKKYFYRSIGTPHWHNLKNLHL